MWPPPVLRDSTAALSLACLKSQRAHPTCLHLHLRMRKLIFERQSLCSGSHVLLGAINSRQRHILLRNSLTDLAGQRCQTLSPTETVGLGTFQSVDSLGFTVRSAFFWPGHACLSRCSCCLVCREARSLQGCITLTVNQLHSGDVSSFLVCLSGTSSFKEPLKVTGFLVCIFQLRLQAAACVNSLVSHCLTSVLIPWLTDSRPVSLS